MKTTKELGWVEGDVFVVIGDHHTHPKGLIVELVKDDNSSCPGYASICGKWDYSISGGKFSHTSNTNVKRIGHKTDPEVAEKITTLRFSLLIGAQSK